MKRYPKYKPFGNYWISEIPSHWNEQKIKHLFDERVEKGHPDEPLLAATQNQGVILKSDYESRTVEATKDLHLLKFVKEGDFVISLRSFQGGIEYSYCQGIISPAYTIMIPRSEIDSSYFRHLAKSRTFIELLKGCVTGIREGQNINYALLRTYLLPLPPIEEQKIIADFLDKKTKQIDRFISLQKEAISLLKELRQAEITKAVTKGLDENAEMKDSGVEWIGEISSNYTVRRLKYLLNEPLMYGANETGISYDVTLPRYIRITDITLDGKLKGGDKLSLSEDIAYPYLLKNNDVLFARSGGTVGKAFIYKSEYGRSAFAGYLIKASTNEHLLPDYLYYYTQSSLYEEWKNQVFILATIQNIGADKYGNLPIIWQPINEQQKHVDYLNKKCAEIDSAIQNKEALIEKVTEYKTRLISDAVTGNIDVRN